MEKQIYGRLGRRRRRHRPAQPGAGIRFHPGGRAVGRRPPQYSRRDRRVLAPRAPARLPNQQSHRRRLVAARRAAGLGVPEIAKTDNGQEYVSNHVRRIFQALDVDHWCSEPFSPWQKSFIERFFRSFSHDLLEYLPGFVGHNVAEREALRARQQFSDRLFVKNRTVELALTAEALQEFCDRWVAGYHSRPHGALAGKRPVEMLAGWRQPVRAVGNERALDLLLSEAPGDGWRIVSKASGIRLNGYDYLAPELGRCVGELGPGAVRPRGRPGAALHLRRQRPVHRAGRMPRAGRRRPQSAGRRRQSAPEATPAGTNGRSARRR
ncbi:MAG: DDE-type integrase/transposase/recombinase [Candidatus Competibacteraceae bacterium]|nr:DDE-type integrase/transposase/recombinase [Candidatus Competibacteraceae bacterium]